MRQARRALVLLVVTVGLLVGPASLIHAGAPVDPGGVWVKTDREEALERLFLHVVYPQIQAAVAGSYREAIQFDQERVISIHHHERYPGVLRVVVEVKTFHGAHNYVGVDHLEFTWEPGGLRLQGVKHEAYESKVQD